MLWPTESQGLEEKPLKWSSNFDPNSGAIQAEMCQAQERKAVPAQALEDGAVQAVQRAGAHTLRRDKKPMRRFGPRRSAVSIV